MKRCLPSFVRARQQRLTRGFAAIAAWFPAWVAAAPLPPDDVNELFAVTCMKHFEAQAGLQQAMLAWGARELPADKATFFLADSPGKAWLLIAPSSAYVVARRDDAVCAVFAQRADAERVRADFTALVATAPAPLVAAESDVAPPGWADELARTLSYAWSRPGDKQELLFVLTTTTATSRHAAAQAMVSLSRVARAAGAVKAAP